MTCFHVSCSIEKPGLTYGHGQRITLHEKTYRQTSEVTKHRLDSCHFWPDSWRLLMAGLQQAARKPHRILRKAPFSHWWTSSSHLHVYIHIRIISMLIYIFGSNFRISINSYQVPFQKTQKFSSFKVIMMSIPPSGFSPPHFAWCRGEDRWVQADCFLGVVHISPIGGLYATYHLLGERNATIEVIFWTMGIHYPCPLSACIHLPTNPYQEHFCLNFETGFRNYKVHLNKGTNKTKNHWFLLDLGSGRV